MNWKNTGLFVFIILILTFLGIMGFMFSVADSPTLNICGDSLSADGYSFPTASIFGYTITRDGIQNKVIFGDDIWKFSYPRGTPNNPSCGTIVLPDGSTAQFNNHGSSSDSSCPNAVYGFPLAFSNGKIVNSSDENVDLLIEGCYNLYNGEIWNCRIKVDIPKGLIYLDYDNTNFATFVGQDVKIPLVVTNNWSRAITGTLYVDYLVETPFGNATKTEKFDDITLDVGKNTITTDIPTKNVAEFMWFKARLETEITDFSGFPTKCHSSGVMLESIGVKSFETDWERIVINPKPLYLPLEGTDDCSRLEGYDKNQDGTFCIRDDIKELGCMQIGCPVFENLTNEYFCTSTGVCAETVYKQGCNNDSDCEDFGAVCMASAFDNETKFCVKTEIEEIIKNIPEPVYVERTCADIDYCADGYECVDDELDDGTKVAVCVRESMNLNNLPWWLALLMIIIGVGLIYVIGSQILKRL